MRLNSIIEKAAKRHGLNPFLVQAVVRKESSLNPDAVRYEPNYRWLYRPETFNDALGITVETESELQKFSWGLMQVMGAVAREYGFHGPLPKLCRPDYGLEYGCRHLRGYLKRFGELEKALAAYNGGPGAVNSDGTLDNQKQYVDPVMKLFWALQKCSS